MTKSKKCTLPAVTPNDLARCPELLRRTPTGWAWRCQQCRQFASSKASEGIFVCRNHGSSLRLTAEDAAGEAVGVNFSATSWAPSDFKHLVSYERITAFMASHLADKPDATELDENELFMRAYVEEMHGLYPQATLLEFLLSILVNWADEFPQLSVTNQEVQMAKQMLGQLDLSSGWAELMGSIQKMLELLAAFDERLTQGQVQLRQFEMNINKGNGDSQELNVLERASNRVAQLMIEHMSRDQLRKVRDNLRNEIEKLN
jgi:hypothetical protein